MRLVHLLIIRDCLICNVLIRRLRTEYVEGDPDDCVPVAEVRQAVHDRLDLSLGTKEVSNLVRTAFPASRRKNLQKDLKRAYFYTGMKRKCLSMDEPQCNPSIEPQIEMECDPVSDKNSKE